MTVLFFTRLFYPHIGGVEKHVFEVSRRLMKKGHKVIVVTELHDSTLPKHEKLEKIEVYRIPITTHGWFKKFVIWYWLWKNKRLIKKATIVHCHDVFFWYLPFRFLYPQKKVYTTFHGYEGDCLPTQRAIIMHKIAEIFSYGTVCVGDYLKKWYGTNPDMVTYGAIEMPQKPRSKKRVKQGTHAVFLGRLEPETGILVYLAALRLLKIRGKTVTLTVLGDGSLREEAEAFCQKHNLPVLFKGFHTDIYSFLFPADIVFTSRFLSTMETMVAQKPAFVVYNNAIKHDCFSMAPYSGWITLANSPQKLASRIEAYLADPPSFSAKTEQAYQWVKKQTWDKLTSRYLYLWNV